MEVDVRPIWLESKGDKAVLLIHGLAGTSFEVRGLAEHLHQEGLTVYAPTLSFHQSRDLDDLEKSNLEVWKEDAENAYAKLSKFRKVYVGGISNGGSLSSYLAITQKPDGLITICPPIIPGFSVFRYLNHEKVFRWLSQRFRYLPRFDYHMVRDWTLAKDLPRFRKLPSHFTYHGMVLARFVRENLSKITAPILVVQAKYDNRVDPKGAEYILEAVSSEVKELYYAENSGHVVVLDIDREAVFKVVADFIRRL
jgi:carboxylesterase